jgi:putative ABC transport system permease protein
MNRFKLVQRSLRFHARSHLGVLLGAVVGSAALIGALIVGDSVKESLRDQALQRLGRTAWALFSQDRLIRSGLAETWRQQPEAKNLPAANAGEVAAVLNLPTTAASPDNASRANQVHLYGVDERFCALAGSRLYASIQADGVVLNRALAAQLRVEVGSPVVLRVRKPSALAREAVISPQSDFAVAMRLHVQAIAQADALGNFSLTRSQIPPFNAFVSLTNLQAAVQAARRANLLLLGQDGSGRNNSRETLSSHLAQVWDLADAELELRPLEESGALELRSSRIFLDSPVVSAALRAATNAQPVLTYLVNQLRVGTNAAPYSMVTASGPPLTPPEMSVDEILINQWLADDLDATPGRELSLTYFLPEAGGRLLERTNRFRIRSIVPMTLPWADRTLMPEFPGIAKAESTHDWDAGFPLVHPIRAKDDRYWKERRGTPKAFLTLKAGQDLWANRFGQLTAIRFPIPSGLNATSYRALLTQRILADLAPGTIGLRFEPVREQALAAANQSEDFGGLFLGFSFFLIIAALILMAMLFQFGLEQRLNEVGTLLALGFTPGKVRMLLLLEGVPLALVGGLVGVLGGMAYAKAMLYGLTTLWRDAVGTSALHFYITLPTLAIGLFSAVLVGLLTIGLALWKQVRRPARELLAEGAGTEGAGAPTRRSKGAIIGPASTLLALVIVGWALGKQEQAAEAFFGAGSLLLIGGLGFAAWLFAILARSGAAHRTSLAALGLRGVTRRRKRSLASVALLASGSFLVIAVGANRLDANLHAEKRSSGTGGFAFLGATTLPVPRDLNTPEGKDFFGLSAGDLEGVSFVPMRLKEGDDASCLNMNRAQTPRLLGVNPALLDARGAFTFAKLAEGTPADHPWLSLSADGQGETVPAIGDENSILWAMHKKVGDTLDYTDERGRVFKIRLVGAVANSILQGNLLIDERAFLNRFPSASGYRMFLIDGPSKQVDRVAATLSRAMQDVGLELTPAAQRLAQFNAVQNTYLNTFQVLGGLGLLLGSVGLGVVVLRNVLERRGELALLQAVGFRKRTLRWLVLSEHGALLLLGLAVGVIAAWVAILPALLRPGAELPLLSLGMTLAAVFATGLLWTWLSARLALRGDLLPALRNE